MKDTSLRSRTTHHPTSTLPATQCRAGAGISTAEDMTDRGLTCSHADYCRHFARTYSLHLEERQYRPSKRSTSIHLRVCFSETSTNYTSSRSRRGHSFRLCVSRWHAYPPAVARAEDTNGTTVAHGRVFPVRCFTVLPLASLLYSADGTHHR
jgi:hypothetical protein